MDSYCINVKYTVYNKPFWEIHNFRPRSRLEKISNVVTYSNMMSTLSTRNLVYFPRLSNYSFKYLTLKKNCKRFGIWKAIETPFLNLCNCILLVFHMQEATTSGDLPVTSLTICEWIDSLKWWKNFGSMSSHCQDNCENIKKNEEKNTENKSGSIVRNAAWIPYERIG